MYSAQMLQKQNRYLESTVQTGNPAQILIMLFDGAVRFTKMGIEAIETEQVEKANLNLTKAQDIVSELMITLDQDAPIAESLLQLYDFVKFSLIEANVKKDAAHAVYALEILESLRETWKEAALAAKKPKQQEV